MNQSTRLNKLKEQISRLLPRKRLEGPVFLAAPFAEGYKRVESESDDLHKALIEAIRLLLQNQENPTPLTRITLESEDGMGFFSVHLIRESSSVIIKDLESFQEIVTFVL